MTGPLPKATTLTPPSFNPDAACNDKPSLWWFALPVEGGSRDPLVAAEAEQMNGWAKDVCRSCPILADCLGWAMQNERYGLWGGLNSWERQALGGLRTPERWANKRARMTLTRGLREFPKERRDEVSQVLTAAHGSADEVA